MIITLIIKDLSILLEEERDKKPCIKYLSGSSKCLYGIICRNSHKSTSQLEYLEDLYRLECHNKRIKYELDLNKNKNSKIILIKEKSTHNFLLSDYLNRNEEEMLENYLPKYKLPYLFKNNKHLPISLIPPNYKDFINYDINTWK